MTLAAFRVDRRGDGPAYSDILAWKGPWWAQLAIVSYVQRVVINTAGRARMRNDLRLRRWNGWSCMVAIAVHRHMPHVLYAEYSANARQLETYSKTTVSITQCDFTYGWPLTEFLPLRVS